MEFKSFTIIICVLLHFILSATASKYNIPAIYVFGDSIFDAGTNRYVENCTAQADFPPYGSSFFRRPTGRFTNGRTVADFLSEFMGIRLQKPYLEAEFEFSKRGRSYPSNGLNFASAGSGVLQETNNASGVLSVQIQLQQFQTVVHNSHVKENLLQQSLFFLESGSNDIFAYFMPFDSPTLTPAAYVKSMLAQVRGFVDRIYKLGGRRFVLFSLGPVGCVPARVNLPGAPIDKCYGKMNKMVKIYNMGLENLAKEIPSKYPGAVGFFGAVYQTVQIFRANRQRYGFADASSACCGYGRLGGEVQCGKEGYQICADPNTYLFWDFFHPSERTYKLISKALWAGGKRRIRPFNLKKLATMDTL